ncbi:MAG: hypothetical protein ACTSW1_00570 [Candidatus Hodarchaeales archaeon]
MEKEKIFTKVFREACKSWDGDLRGEKYSLECEVSHGNNFMIVFLDEKDFGVQFYPPIGNIQSIKLRDISDMTFNPKFRDNPLTVQSKDKKIIITKQKGEKPFVDLEF